MAVVAAIPEKSERTDCRLVRFFLEVRNTYFISLALNCYTWVKYFLKEMLLNIFLKLCNSFLKYSIRKLYEYSRYKMLSKNCFKNYICPIIVIHCHCEVGSKSFHAVKPNMLLATTYLDKFGSLLPVA